MQSLFDYSWPGNIRQLRNVIERLSILQENGVIQPEHLPSAIRSQQAMESVSVYQPSVLSRPAPHAMFSPAPSGTERERIVAALARTYGNKKAAAELLGISRGTLYNKMKKYGLHEESFRWE
jgi:transcriptional regulator of acetoin/glycerol metabolism